MKILIIFLTFSIIFLQASAKVDVCIPNVFGVENTKENLEVLMDDVKNIFTGNDKNKAVEDSLYIGHIDVDVDHPAMRLVGTLDNVTMYGIENMTLCLLEHFSILHLTRPFDLFNMTAPNISFTGKYNIKGNIGQLFDIFGEGDFWLHLYQFSVKALNVTAYAKEDGLEEKVCFPINVNVHLNKTECHFYGLMNDPELEEIFNKVFAKMAPEAVSVIWDEIKQADDELLQKLINKLMDQIFHKDGLEKMIRLIFSNSYKMKMLPICNGLNRDWFNV